MSIIRKTSMRLAVSAVIVGLSLAWLGTFPRWLAGEASSGQMVKLLVLSSFGLVSLSRAATMFRKQRSTS